MSIITGVNHGRLRLCAKSLVVLTVIFSLGLMVSQNAWAFESKAVKPENSTINGLSSPHLLWQYNVLVALNPAACTDGTAGVTINGSGNTTLNGGGILAYGCLRGNGNAGSVEIEQPFKPLGRFLSPGNLAWNPPPEYYRSQIDLQFDFTDQAEAACNDLPKFEVRNDQKNRDTIISPGNYPYIIVTDTLTMLPGLYCLSGDFTVENGALLSGQGVTIYMSDGNFSVQGGAEVHLAAPPEGILSDPVWQDLLLYVANDHNATVLVNGSIASSYHGVVYAPASNIDVFGTAQFQIQLIGWNLEAGGANDLDLAVDFWPELPVMKVGRD